MISARNPLLYGLSCVNSCRYGYGAKRKRLSIIVIIIYTRENCAYK
jgi:hypothetical protein